MGALLARAGRRHWLRHPWQAVLAVLGVAMGVALVVAVDLASQSARASYLWSAETLAGRATHHVLGAAGGLPDSLYARLRLAGLRDGAGRPVPMTPVLEARVSLAGPPRKAGKAGAGGGGAPDTGGPSGGPDTVAGPGPAAVASWRLVGVDPFSSRDLGAFGLFEGGEAGAGGSGALEALLARPGTVLLSRDDAERLGLGPGDTLRLRAGERTAEVTVLGFLEPRNRLARNLVDGLLLADLSTAQEALGREGRLSRIEADLSGAGPGAGAPAGADETLAARVRALLPPGAHLAPANARALALDSMTRAFRVNLTALSLVALLVGAFLIYNTMSFSVAQRWNLLGTLRGLGAEPRQVALLVCREAAALSALGAALGVAAGILLGRGLVVLVARTVNDLYFATRVAGLALDPWVLAKGALLGLGMGLLASAGPAWHAAGIRPRTLLTRSAQEARLRGRLPRLRALGLLLALGAGVLAWLPGRGLLPAFASLACGVLAWALWTPDLLRRLAAFAAAALRAVPGAAGTLARMAVREVGASLSRTAVAAAALTAALSVTVAMGIMVDSFRRALADWLETVLVADVYAASPRDGSGRPSGPLDTSWLRSARALPEVAGSTTYLAAALLHPDGLQTQVLALEMDPRSRRAFVLRAGDSASAWRAFHRSPDCGLLVSEPLAFRHGLAPGSALELPTPAGPRRFPVAGIFTDYGSDQGVAALDRACFAAHWKEEAGGATSLALFAAPGADAAALARRLASLPGAGAVEVHPTASLKSASLEIFDRTFAITSVLRLAAVAVALAGLVGALAALELERAPETALLRALGLTPGQTFGLASLQAAFLGAASGLLAVPLGLLQAGLLVHVINRRSFGWTMPLAVDPAVCAQAVLLGLVAALLAALLPAWKAARAVTARALREE